MPTRSALSASPSANIIADKHDVQPESCVKFIVMLLHFAKRREILYTESSCEMRILASRGSPSDMIAMLLPPKGLRGCPADGAAPCPLWRESNARGALSPRGREAVDLRVAPAKGGRPP